MSRAACRDTPDPGVFFPASAGDAMAGQAEEAKAVCAACPVRAVCLRYALATRQEFGVWGGTTETERRAMIRRAGTAGHGRVPAQAGSAASEPTAIEPPARTPAVHMPGPPARYPRTTAPHTESRHRGTSRETLTVTIPAAELPGKPLSADRGQALCAEPGDTLVIDGAGMAGLPRIGRIIATAGPNGGPPYLVRWTAGDYESQISPGPAAHIERSRALP